MKIKRIYILDCLLSYADPLKNALSSSKYKCSGQKSRLNSSTSAGKPSLRTHASVHPSASNSRFLSYTFTASPRHSTHPGLRITTMTHGFSLHKPDAANDSSSSRFGSGLKRMSLTSPNDALTRVCLSEYVCVARMIYRLVARGAKKFRQHRCAARKAPI